MTTLPATILSGASRIPIDSGLKFAACTFERVGLGDRWVYYCPHIAVVRTVLRPHSQRLRERRSPPEPIWEETIESILAQTFEDFELVISQGCQRFGKSREELSLGGKSLTKRT